MPYEIFNFLQIIVKFFYIFLLCEIFKSKNTLYISEKREIKEDILMVDEVRNSGNRLTQEEIAARRDAFNKIQENGHEIILTMQPKNPNNSGVSYDYMARLNQDIEAGIFEDVNQDGFTKKEKS